MLTRVRIDGFRGLGDVDVPLRPLTAIIGQNDTGKSSFLHGLNYLLGIPNLELSRPDIRRLDEHQRVTVEGWFGSGRTHRKSYALGDGGHNAQTDEPEARTYLDKVRMFFLPAHGVPMECGGSASTRPPMLSGNGDNLADLLDFFLRNDRARFDAIEAAVREHVPGVEKINVSTPMSASNRSIDLVIDNGLGIQGGTASAGVRLILFFIALAHHPEPPKLILVEEPENGVHPRRLAEIVDLLRATTSGKYGDPAQVVLSTHSPYLLDNLDPDTDQVLVFHRRGDGIRTAAALDHERLSEFRAGFMLGEVWFNQGEEGLVAKTG
jgi:predicted ATPase